ncbi:MAG: TonB family protein [Gammaproteobacteria bacterium]|nr:TonB family protein [Gammaproteobacteria bacterium]
MSEMLRHLPRMVFSILGGMAISLSLLWMMNWMLIHKTTELQARQDRPVMEFVRLKRDTDTRVRERRQPDPPPVAEEIPPPTPEIRVQDVTRPTVRAPNIQFSVPKLPMSFSGPYIGPVRQGPPDRDFITISRVAPQYPFRAQRRGIEGWVKVSLLITAQGTVQDVVVVDAEPEGVFDRAAVQAVSKWKFKPRIQDGKAVSVRAEQTVNFQLGK